MFIVSRSIIQHQFDSRQKCNDDNEVADDKYKGFSNLDHASHKPFLVINTLRDTSHRITNIQRKI